MSDTENNPSTPENDGAADPSAADAEWLRAEITRAPDKARQARLLGEAGEVAEREGDEPAAARDYLAAFNADPTFREPLEALVRLLERRRSLKNLGRVIDALDRAAVTPAEKARALVMRAAYLEDVQGDVDAAKGVVLEALRVGEQDPALPETATAALALELVAARLGDAALREEAMTERAKRTDSASWKALLLLDLGRMAAAAGEVDRALERFGDARALGSGATFAAAVAAERLARTEPGLPGTDEARTRATAYAEALEAQAALIAEAMSNAERGDELGVPQWLRDRAFIADAYLRAADVWRLSGDAGRAATVLDRALELLAGAEQPEGEADPLVVRALLAARIRAAETVGDSAVAASLAERRLATETDGPTIAALAMRVAEEAAGNGDAGKALEAVTRAAKADPGSIPARALQLDLLAGSSDATSFAEQIEASADALATDEARGKLLLLSAFVWGIRAGDVAAAKAALSQAAMYGVAPATVARFGRMLAMVSGDATWQDEAARRLVVGGATDAELPQLWFEIARSRLARDDQEGAKRALAELAALPSGAWLGQALEALLPGGDGAASAAAWRELAALDADPDLARALKLIAALRAERGGDADTAREVLRDLFAGQKDDLLVVGLLQEMELAAGDPTAAAIVAEEAAAATEDPQAAASQLLFAGLLRWRAGDKHVGLEDFEMAAEKIPADPDALRPDPARVLLGWASRAIEPDSVEGRRKAIARAKEGGGDTRLLALERFATELAASDADAAADALAEVEEGMPGRDLAIAGALARVLWPPASPDPALLTGALARIAEAGAPAFAGAERYRAEREQDAEAATAAAEGWFDVGGGASAALEWLVSATSSGDAVAEAAARHALASSLEPEAHDALEASAALSAMLRADSPAAVHLLGGETNAARLANLELAPPGCDPRRRATALCNLGTVLGEDAQAHAMSMGGWSLLVAGDVDGAVEAFTAVTQANPDDLTAWEGLRTAAEAQGNKELQAVAAQELGGRCGAATRGATFWEEAGNLWLEIGNEQAGEEALAASFQRDARRPTAFDKLFRRVRARKDGDRLLELMQVRLEHTDDPPEVAKLFWEQARVLREKGDSDGALHALENVTMIEPDHVGALALTGEIFIRRGMYAEAADRLARLATLDAAPAKNRVTAGVAAVDLYEKKLDQPEQALRVLVSLHKAKLSTLPVRERLAKAAAKTGSWEEATSILEELMRERPEAAGRIEAARLAMAIYRDRIGAKERAAVVVHKLLEEAPGDGEAVDLLLEIDVPDKQALLGAARATLLGALQKQPSDADAARRLARVAGALGEQGLQGTAATVAVALAGRDAVLEQTLAQLRARQPRTVPQIALGPSHLQMLLCVGDDGPIAALFALLAPTLAEALGPSLQALGVGKRDRVDPRAGLALRNEMAAWAGTFGLPEFDLYVGGKDPLGVQGVPGDTPAIVVGASVNAPFDVAARARVVREIFGLARGTSVLRTRDETTVAAIVVAACRIADVPIEAPPYAVLAEVEKLVSKAIARRTRKALPEILRTHRAGPARPQALRPARARVAGARRRRRVRRRLRRPRRSGAPRRGGRPARAGSAALRPLAGVPASAQGPRPRGTIMTDDDKKGPLQDFDWDAALAEWDKDPAEDEEKEAAPKEPAAPAAPSASKPLYRPPAPTIDPASAQIAARAGRPAPPPLPKRRGGLSQLFARGDAARKEDDIEVELEAPVERKHYRAEDDEEGVVTSAVDVAAPPDIGPPEPLQVPGESEPEIPEGAMFDPFDDRPRKPPPPRPAAPAAPTNEDDELEQLLGGLEEPKDLPPPRSAQPTAPAFDEAEEAPPTPAVVPESEEAEDVPALASTAEVEAVPPAPPAAPADAIVFEDELPVVQLLDETMLEAVRERATWLEEEAHNVVDKMGSAQTLLVASELRAMAGDSEDAERLAREAIELAPHMALAHRQLRGLGPRDGEAIVSSIDEELRHAPVHAAKLHGALLASQALGASGDDEGAAKRLEQATRMAPGDARVVTARAARALSRGELNSPALRAPDSLPTLATAIDSALRLRGVERGEAREGTSADDAMRRARAAVEKGDVVAAAERVGEITSDAALAGGARWLAATLAATRTTARARAVELLGPLVEAGDELARRAMAARGMELGDAAIVARAVAGGSSFSPAERVALAALAGFEDDRRLHDLEALAATDDGVTLAAAATPIVARPGAGAEVAVLSSFAERVAGAPGARAASQLARLLGQHAPPAAIDAAIEALAAHAPQTTRALRLDESAREGHHDEVSATLSAWGEGAESGRTDRYLASALIAERAGLPERAAAAYRSALDADAANEAALRALAAVDSSVDPVADIQRLAAEEEDPVRAALLRLEAYLRRTPEEDARLPALEQVHEGAPGVPVAAFLAERIARERGDLDEVLRWLRERQKASADPIERAFDNVREALLIADKEPALASERLEEAHRARPEDVALRQLYERMAPEPPPDRAAWREQRAAAAAGDARETLLLEAVYEYERSGDREGALRAAQAATPEGKGPPLALIARERAELAAGEASRLADELLSLARTAPDVRARTEAYERLAELDALARNDPGSALLWHRSILEETPDHALSLRYVEHALLGERRDDELEPVLTAIARMLDQKGGEASAHAEVAARLRMRNGDWDGTRDLAELGARQPAASLWSLRLGNAHARAKEDDAALLESTRALIARASRPVELAALLARGAEAAERVGKLDDALELLERATREDPGDVTAWRALAQLRTRRGEHAQAADALESLARTSAVDEHRLEAWYEAGRILVDEAKDQGRGVAAFEQAASINIAFKDIFGRLSKLYAARGARNELASLLERRISTVLDPDERVALEVERGSALAEVGEFAVAKEAFEAALAVQPDHVGALTAFGDMCAKREDWEGAEQAWVRLARLVASPEEQLAIYRRLGDLYAGHIGNLSRAEVALREVLKRAPEDVAAKEQLVEVYKRQNDAPQAMEIQQQLLATASDPATKRLRTIGLASIYETVSHDLRKAEQTLESARREFPSDVNILRALAEFYVRHKQTPAVNILLDRAAGDARRAFAAGRFSPALFETMATVHDIRGKTDAARAVAATLAAFTGEPADIAGAEARALDPRLDELIAPEAMTPAARGLLARTGHALDAAAPFDPRQLRATLLDPGDAFGRAVMGIAQSVGMANMQLFVSPQLGNVCLPGGSNPPALVFGEPMLKASSEKARSFALLRALKLIQVHGSAFARVGQGDVPILVGAWLKIFAPQWTPPGINPAQLTEATRRVQSAMPRQIDPATGSMALEVIGALGPQIGALGGAVLAWANHAALLAVGDPNAAMEAVAFATGRGEPPPAGDARAGWIARMPEVKELIAFTVSDGYAEARTRLGFK